jgi:N-methylhydantoinase B/oxoprolinase/acetone carboxylase alpha subunit
MVSRETTEKLIEAQISIAKSLEGIQTNLKYLNDNNILHTERQINANKTIIDSLKLMTEKYWWLIIALIGALMFVMGYQEFVTKIL